MVALKMRNCASHGMKAGQNKTTGETNVDRDRAE
jgi:hypothetical protein